MNEFDAILIAGPTAGGKSAMAMALASAHNGVVINADSMQVYDTLRVLTARPSVAETESVPHELYGHIPAVKSYSTGQWLRDVEKALVAVRSEGRLPIFVGGTGLYFKALTGGLSDMPVVPAEIRDHYRTKLRELGAQNLFLELKDRDPEVSGKLNASDGQRIVRALEILSATGQSIAAFTASNGPKIVDPETARKIVVLPDRALLHNRINKRFSIMMDQGAIEEVEALLAQNPDPASPLMKAIGVREIARFLQGDLSREGVITLASAATRQYAKRQMTWFRNQMDDTWERIDPYQTNDN